MAACAIGDGSGTRWQLIAIPTAGGTSFLLLSYIGDSECSAGRHPQYGNSVFKVAMLYQWVVCLNRPELIDQGLMFLTQLEPDLPADAKRDAYHITVIREMLTRHLDDVLPSAVDELRVVCDELLPTKQGDTVALPGMKVILDIVARVVSRTFIGLPYCKCWHVGTLRIWTRRSQTYAPLPRLQEGIKRNDVTVKTIATRLQLENFAALHTSSNMLAHALFHILVDPSLVPPLCEEAREALEAHGWTRPALEKIPKMDSFLKESQRLNGINVCDGYDAESMQDVVLVDGTFLPTGTLCAVPGYCPHHDEEKYDGANDFKAFRFSDTKEAGGTRQQFVNTFDEFMAFRRGKHACPGRFFAAMELKVILA
ncbi:cytochrome P450 [Cerioporus squamosus]|nr:cytochrome P450 [Cerioporus squamosus]